MTKRIIVLSFMILSSNLFTQNYNEEFKQICKRGKISESKDFFEKWKKSEPENPEMFVGLFNYYYVLSKSKMGEPNFLGGYLISEKDSVNIKEINKTFNEGDSLFNLAQGYLIRGINENKDRLDMYLGRSATLKDKGISFEFLESIKSIVIRNNLNEGKWLWSNNQPIEKTEDEFVNIIQTYMNSMFQVSNPRIEAILEITEITLKKYTNNYILLTNKGLCLSELGKYKEAILYFKKGLKSNPSDMIIRFNLADSYVQLQKIKEAKKIYNYIIENGGNQYAEYAKDILNKIE